MRPALPAYSPLRPVVFAACLLVASISHCDLFADDRRQLHFQTIDLPGYPHDIHSVDMNGDGRRDLLIVCSKARFEHLSKWGPDSSQEIEGLGPIVTETLTIIPRYLRERNVSIFLADSSGKFAHKAQRALPPSTLSITSITKASGVYELTDNGVNRLTFNEKEIISTSLTRIRPLIAGTQEYHPHLKFLHLVNSDDYEDLVIPTRENISIYLGTVNGFEKQAASQMRLPGTRLDRNAALASYSPVPVFTDLNGDGINDLVIREQTDGGPFLYFAPGIGEGRFRATQKVSLPTGVHRVDTPTDIDGDGKVEFPMLATIPGTEGTFPPVAEFGIYDLAGSQWPLTVKNQPSFRRKTQGNDWPIDLNGDGLQDLLVGEYRGSLFWKALKALFVGKIAITVDFQVLCQQTASSFGPAKGERIFIRGEFGVDSEIRQVTDLQIPFLDFNGDGLLDMMKESRGRRLEVRFGNRDCGFSRSPDIVIDLARQLEDWIPLDTQGIFANLTTIDVDGNGSDDVVIRETKRDEDNTNMLHSRLHLILGKI